MRESLARQRTNERNRETLLRIGAYRVISPDSDLHKLCAAYERALFMSEQRAMAEDVKALLDNDASIEDEELDIRE